MLTQVGFFDFVHGPGDPLGCLGDVMDRTDRRGEHGFNKSLVVVPEAFNLGKPYYASPKTPNIPGSAAISAEEALIRLKGLSEKYSTVFVAGLLDRQFSAAYWVDPDSEPKLMCYKMGDDRSGNYFGSQTSDPFNPIEKYGACIGALICFDALDCAEESAEARIRRAKLLADIKRRDQPHRIMCIPAHMASHCMPQMEGMWCILASSGGRRSVVMDPKKSEVLNVELRGKIRFVDLPSALPAGRTI